MNRTDPLDHDQQVRAACVHEAGRVLMTEDPYVEDLLAVAEYILTGGRDSGPITRADIRRQVDEYTAAVTGGEQTIWKRAHELPDNPAEETP